MANIEVDRVADDLLAREVWRFSFFAKWTGNVIDLRLDWYSVESRKTTRHKWRSERLWDRGDQRSYHSTIKAADVPLPPDVVMSARASVRFGVIGAERQF